MSKRTEVIRLTLTPDEKHKLQAAADKASTPLAVWVRALAMAAARG